MRDGVLLIGVDGGATEVKAHAATCDDLASPTAFELRHEAASRVYPVLPGFAPAPVSEQLAARAAGNVRPSEPEREQAEAWTTSAAEAVGDVARQADATRLLVGMGMPGLKTSDGRGINAINNGPRCPTFLDDLERKLAADFELAAPIAALGSDADYCGLGEEHARAGLFRDVADAYYVGCGTGIADALKLGGTLVPFDAIKPWIQKSWQMPSALGPTFEKLVSAKSLNAVYDGLLAGWHGLRQSGGGDEGTAQTQRHTDAPQFAEQAAAAGQPVARAWLHAAALVLAELIFERLWTIKNGRAAAAHRGEGYGQLAVEHEYRGTVLERAIIGQRLGQLFAAASYQAYFAAPLERCLATMIREGGDAELANRWLAISGDALKPGRLVASHLRAAPALGAAVAAVMALTK